MGSNQFGSRCGNGVGNSIISNNSSSSQIYTLADIKSFKVTGIQFGTNPLVDSIVIGQAGDITKDDYSPPLVIGFHNGIGGVLADIFRFGKNNCVHCFCFLEVEELEDKDEGIVIEFGEYNYGDPNDLTENTIYESKKGGLRYYIVKKNIFEKYCGLARIKCEINKKESLDDIIIGISKNYRWRLEYYNRDKQNCHDFAAVLLEYLEIQRYEICKGSTNNIPDKILRVLNIEK